MSPKVLTRCPQCGSPMTFANVTGVTQLEDNEVSVGMACSDCKFASHVRVMARLWEQLTVGEERFGVKSDERQVPGGRQIGQVVKAFAEVELANVYSLEDIAWIWDYQAKVSPESIPVEV